jgi:general secretion pathway protein D
MQAILERHPKQPLRLVERELNGERQFALLYGSYPNRAMALKALADLPEQLPARHASARPE